MPAAMVINPVESLRERVADWKRQGDVIAFVPTMGNLHDGHLALVKAANEQASRTIVSIFVNPMQFAPDEDFATYPRTFTDDIAKLADFNVDAVFSPEQGIMYPAGEQQSTFIDVPELSSVVEGQYRPGFFRGVATVVNKLFNIVQPDLAFFGEKDYQQLLVIRKMVKDLNLPVVIHSVPTQREPDGLAMSSRNQYLSPDERETAGLLYQSILFLRDLVLQGMTFTEAETQVVKQLVEHGFVVDYLTIRDPEDLALPVFKQYTSDYTDQSLIILAAARLGVTRLIDNLVFKLKVMDG